MSIGKKVAMKNQYKSSVRGRKTRGDVRDGKK